jgi:hypothetical protein
MSDMQNEVADINSRLAVLESLLGAGGERRRLGRFGLKTLLWLMALAAVLTFAVIAQRNAVRLDAENAKLGAEIATLRATASALEMQMAALRDRNPIEAHERFIEKYKAEVSAQEFPPEGPEPHASP